MANTVLGPTAGYIYDVAHGAEPGPLDSRERETLRSLARQVAEIAAHPKQEAKRDLWYRHNRLESVRPLVLVFPEDSWVEIIGEDALELADPFWRQQEWYLRHLIYRDGYLCDDYVVEPHLYVTRIVHTGGWGMEPIYTRPDNEKGSVVWDPPLKDPDDITKLTKPTIEVDEVATQRNYDAVSEVFADVLPVEIYCKPPSANLISTVTHLRGIDQVMLDMYDRPEWLHQLMDLMAESALERTEYMERGGYLTLNNRGHYNDSGGIGYSTELPSSDYDGTHVRLQNLWGFGDAQEMVLVGPRQHEEFVVDYQVRLLQHYGLNAYGCCEPYTYKFDMLRKVPRLRRVSVSPWCDLEVAAEELGSDYVFSWKPNPAMIVNEYDPDYIRAYIRRTLEVAKDCVLEMIHKDTFTIRHEPTRLETWAKIAREEIEKV